MDIPSPTTRSSTWLPSPAPRAIAFFCASRWTIPSSSTARQDGSWRNSAPVRYRMYLRSGRKVWGMSSLLLGCALVTLACNQRMGQQPRYEPYEPSEIFADSASARLLPADTVPRGHLRDDMLLFTGKDDNGQDSAEFPFPITRDVMDRGHQRFDIYCVPC